MPRDNKSGAENRKEARSPARGTVRIQLPEQLALEITGKLIDISANGFRAMHTHSDLATGQTVWFRHVAASGQARVIWNCITSDSIETGFLIV